MVKHICPVCKGIISTICNKYDTHYCSTCETAYQIPLPTKEELKQIYDHSYYDSWGDDDVHVQSVNDREELPSYWPLKRALYNRLLSKIEGYPPGSLALDIGCATGASLTVFQDRGWVSYGIDTNPFATNIAKVRAPKAHVYTGKLEDNDFGTVRFDVIVVSDVLEHTNMTANLLLCIYRLLAEDGVAVFLTPDVCSLSSRLMGSQWPHFKKEHLILFSQSSMRKHLIQSGFSNVSIQGFQKPTSIEYVLRQLGVYHFPWLSSTAMVFLKLFPDVLKLLIFSLPMGEMLAIGHKQKDP